MADNNRDVSLQVTATTVGGEAIRKLANDVHDLAKQGGDAAPEFQRLADEIDKLAGQRDAIDTFIELKGAVDALTTDQQKAKDAAGALGKELTDLSATTAKFKESEQQATAEVRVAQQDLAAKRDALARLKVTTDDAAKTEAEYKQAVKDAQLAVLDARASLNEKRAAMQAAQQAARDAGEGEKQLAAQSKLANAEASAATKELARRTAALNESREALQSAGVATEDMTQAQGTLGRAFAETVASIEQQQAAVVALRAKEAAAAERKKAALAEEDRLTSLQINARYRLGAAAREQLEAERQQYAESARLAKEAADQKIAAEQAYASFQKSAAQARRQVEEAFAVTGVKSAQALQAEIRRIDSALITLANDTSITGAEFDRAFASGKKRIQDLEESLNGTAEAATKTSGASRLVSSGFAQLTAAYGGLELAKKFLDANIQLESLRRSLSITTGSTLEAARQIEFLRDTANRSGIAVGEISESYKRFAVSMQQAGISAQTTESVFAAVTRATGLMGQGSERASLALEALSQMAGKGTVSMEELRQQLGDSLPGALKVVADGMGLSVKQLTKMTEAGQIMAADMLPALADQLTKTLAKGTEQVDGFGAAWARAKNLMTLASTTIGDTGALTALTTALRAAGVVAGSVAMGVSTTLDIVFTSIKQLATLTAGVVHGDLKGAVNEAGVLFDQMIDRQAKLGRAIGEMAGGGEQAAAAQRSVGVAAQQAGSQAQAAAGGVNANAQALGAAAAAATGNAQAQQGAGSAATAAGTQAAGAAQGWYAIQAAYIDVNKTAEQNTLIAEKLAQAKKHEGEASVQLAQIGGNEIEMRQAAVRAAQGDEQSLRTLAAARQQEVIYLKAQAESLILAAGGSEKLRDDQREQIKTLNDLIEKKTAEAERSKVAADQAQVETVARHAAAETYKDNAARLAELKVAAESAAAELARMRSQEVDNAESHANVARAAQDAAYAEGLYRDALSDTAAAAERKIAVLRQNASETDIASRASLAYLKTQEQEAQMYGRTAEAQGYQIRQKQVQIQMVRDHIAAVEAETRQTIAAAEADRAALDASGRLNPAKQQEIELRIRNAQAKLREAQAGEQQIRQLQNEIDAIRMRNDAVQEGTRQVGQPGGGAGGGGGRMLQASQNDALMSLADKQTRGTLGSDDLKTAQAAFQAADFNRQVMEQYRAQFSLEGARSVDTAYKQARSILETVQGLQAKTDTGGSPRAAGTKTVNINLNGKKTPVNVASDADAANLTGVMRQLESLQGRSNV
ncbi:tape measure protein [Cupriavidus sp. IK-TO18]|uniref:tape measure protein n=1 Tax=Cupriavidus sp. IK-TO18 TaxID=2782182 RepID=UPI00189BE0EB|nr:tape measure protein [Cupriavidus sp. IK-TO18]MBF6987256.1 tape measure protein [Cupriavidus sp. IK-TO18]